MKSLGIQEVDILDLGTFEALGLAIDKTPRGMAIVFVNGDRPVVGVSFPDPEVVEFLIKRLEEMKEFFGGNNELH